MSMRTESSVTPALAPRIPPSAAWDGSLGGTTSGSLDLLPESAPPGALELSDSMVVLYALQLQQQRSDEKSASAQVSDDAAQREAEIQKQLDALERERRDSGGRGFFSCIGDLLKDFTIDTVEWKTSNFARDMRSDLDACDNPRFWSELESGAKWVALVASAVATVFTCGAAGPLVVGAAILLSVGGFVVQQTQCFGSASNWVGVGMELASAALTCGSSLASSGTQIASTAGTTAACVAGSATATAGVAQAEVAQKQADALDLEARAERAKNSAQALAQIQQWVVQTLQQQTAANQSALQLLTGAMQANDRASLIAIAPLSKG
jgi:hypothetical protein